MQEIINSSFKTSIGSIVSLSQMKKIIPIGMLLSAVYALKIIPMIDNVKELMDKIPTAEEKEIMEAFQGIELKDLRQLTIFEIKEKISEYKEKEHKSISNKTATDFFNKKLSFTKEREVLDIEDFRDKEKGEISIIKVFFLFNINNFKSPFVKTSGRFQKQILDMNKIKSSFTTLAIDEANKHLTKMKCSKKCNTENPSIHNLELNQTTFLNRRMQKSDSYKILGMYFYVN